MQEAVVSTSWVEDHLKDPGIRAVEVDIDTQAYEEGHLPGAVGWAWNTQLCDTLRRDIIRKDEFEKLMSESGVSNDTAVILYGDNNNWFAAWAFWQLKILRTLMKPQNYSKRKTEAAGWQVNVTSYQLGDRFYATVDNVSPGAWIAKTEGVTREESEQKALDRAAELLRKTRKIPAKPSGGTSR